MTLREDRPRPASGGMAPTFSDFQDPLKFLDGHADVNDGHLLTIKETTMGIRT